MQTTILLGTTLLGSLLQHVAAAPEVGSSKRASVTFPDCIGTCMRNSGCFDADCICDKADDGILSDIVICMNQWCPADVTATDLLEPLSGECDLPKSAVQDAEKKGGIIVDVGDDDEGETPSTTSAKPTATSSGNKGDDDDDSSTKSTPTSTAGSKDGEDEDITMTFDLGSPQTNAAGAETTVTPVASGTLTVASAKSTDTATGGLLTDDDSTPTTSGAGSFGAATSISVTPTSTGASGEATGSADDEDNAALPSGQASLFGIVAAMGVALALGF